MSQNQQQKQSELKRLAARAALDYVTPRLDSGSVIGIGTGSTTNCFIDLLVDIRGHFDAAVASSEASTKRLQDNGIRVIDLNAAAGVRIYVDGADEVNPARQMIKGGGGALTREKIIAASAEEFLCIVDDSKLVDQLGGFPLPIEVIPMARGLVARALVSLGGQPVLREGFVTDGNNIILDVHDLDLSDPPRMESQINNIVGVVCNGIFAAQAATRVLSAGAHSIRQF